MVARMRGLLPTCVSKGGNCTFCLLWINIKKYIHIGVKHRVCEYVSMVALMTGLVHTSVSKGGKQRLDKHNF